MFTVQTQMSQIQKTSSDINNRIPQLNEAKKAAVAGNDYVVLCDCSIRVFHLGCSKNTVYNLFY